MVKPAVILQEELVVSHALLLQIVQVVVDIALIRPVPVFQENQEIYASQEQIVFHRIASVVNVASRIQNVSTVMAILTN
jgi:hypothetical protein